MSEMTKLCERFNLTCEYKLGTKPAWDSGQRHYKVQLRFPEHGKVRRLTVDFHTNGTPDAADVLSCLCGDASCGEQSFETFCDELGYDKDSRKAETTWKACKRIAPKLRRFLGKHYDEFSGAEH